MLRSFLAILEGDAVAEFYPALDESAARAGPVNLDPLVRELPHGQLTSIVWKKGLRQERALAQPFDLMHEKSRAFGSEALALQDLLWRPRAPEALFVRAIQKKKTDLSPFGMPKVVVVHAGIQRFRLPLGLGRRRHSARSATQFPRGRDVTANIDGIEETHLKTLAPYEPTDDHGN